MEQKILSFWGKRPIFKGLHTSKALSQEAQVGRRCSRHTTETHGARQSTQDPGGDTWCENSEDVSTTKKRSSLCIYNMYLNIKDMYSIRIIQYAHIMYLYNCNILMIKLFWIMTHGLANCRNLPCKEALVRLVWRIDGVSQHSMW